MKSALAAPSTSMLSESFRFDNLPVSDYHFRYTVNLFSNYVNLSGAPCCRGLPVTDEMQLVIVGERRSCAWDGAPSARVKVLKALARNPANSPKPGSP
jgi:hypothetical protein